jgi:hypothetical protein
MTYLAADGIRAWLHPQCSNQSNRDTYKDQGTAQNTAPPASQDKHEQCSGKCDDR